MIVFNSMALVQIIIAGILGALGGGISWLLGGDTTFWWTAVGALAIVPVDLLMRFGGGGGEEGEAAPPPSLLDAVRPSVGGHLMFVPIWVVGIAGLAVSFITG